MNKLDILFQKYKFNQFVDEAAKKCKEDFKKLIEELEKLGEIEITREGYEFNINMKCHQDGVETTIKTITKAPDGKSDWFNQLDVIKDFLEKSD